MNNKQSIPSEIAQEVISAVPTFFERWALLIFSLIITMLITITWFIKYPDYVSAAAVLTAINGPKDVVIRQDGKLESLFVVNDQGVEKGQVLGYIESTAKPNEIALLSNLLDRGISLISNNESEALSNLFISNFRNLGEIQPQYQQFISALQKYNDYCVNGYYFKKIKTLHEDQVYLNKIHKMLEEQRYYTEQDILLSEEGFAASTTMYNQKVISKQELRNEKSKLVIKKMGLPQLQSTLLANEILHSNKNNEIIELEHTISQQESIFLQAMQTLKSIIDDWKKKYIISAPTTGTITFIVPIQQGQNLPAGKIIGFVKPYRSRYYAQVMLPQQNFGKIKIGQRVQLRFEGYPYEEYGSVEGRLSYISKVPSDSGFLSNVQLYNGLETNYKKSIQYRSGLKAKALIVTRDMRLLERFTYNITQITNSK